MVKSRYLSAVDFSEANDFRIPGYIIEGAKYSNKSIYGSLRVLTPQDPHHATPSTTFVLFFQFSTVGTAFTTFEERMFVDDLVDRLNYWIGNVINDYRRNRMVDLEYSRQMFATATIELRTHLAHILDQIIGARKLIAYKRKTFFPTVTNMAIKRLKMAALENDEKVIDELITELFRWSEYL